MIRALILIMSLTIAACAKQPTQAELEYKAYDRVLSEKVAKNQMTPAEADLARQQYIGALRSRESNIAANQGIAQGQSAYSTNSTMALGAAMMCAGQRGGHC